MSTECNGTPIVFQVHGRREVTASFDGGRLSSDGGALLLREADNVFGVTGRLAGCFSDHRDPERSEHELDCLVAQRVMAIALGYEDLNDHDQLRDDSVLALAVGRGDITGADRVRERDRGHPLASSSSASRTGRRATATRGSPPTRRRSTVCWSRCSWRRTARRPRRSSSISTRRPAARRPGRAPLPRVLRLSLLPAALCHLRRTCAVLPPAAVEHRRVGGRA